MRFPSFDFDQASADLINFYADQANLGRDIDNYFDVACQWLDSVIREEGKIQPAQLQALLRNHPDYLRNLGHVRIKTDVDGSFVSHSLGVRISNSLNDFSDLALEMYPIHLSFLGHNQVFRPFISPTWLGSLIAQLASSISPQSVLDPVSGMGMLLHAINEEVHPVELYGITGAKQLVPYAKALLCNGNAVLFERMPAEISKRQYSLIVADPPVYRWSLDRRGFAKSQAKYPRIGAGHLLVLRSSEMLEKGGMALIVVDETFFYRRRWKLIQEALRSNGCSVSSAIHLPRDLLGKSRRRDYYLITVKRQLLGKMFVCSYQSKDASKQLIDNILHRRCGPEPSLGRLCDAAFFESFTRLVDQESLGRLAKEAGAIPHSLGDVFPGLSKVINEPPAESSSYYQWLSDLTSQDKQSDLPTSICLCLDDFIFSLEAPEYGNFVWLEVNAEKVDPRFLVHWFAATDLGIATRRSLKRIDKVTYYPDIAEILSPSTRFYLPSLQDQQRTLQALSHLQRIRSQVDNLEASLVNGPVADIEAIADKISDSSKDEDALYSAWIETLPYPLASILWRHYSGEGMSYRDRFRTLVNFFEATAEFLSIVHLSAFGSDIALWERYGSDLTEKLFKNSLSLERSTFGAWKAVNEHFISVIRKISSDSDWESILSGKYQLSRRSVEKMIASPKLANILQEANQIRNSYVGHSGAIGDNLAIQVHDQLEALVSRTRGLFGAKWLDYQLIQPVNCKYKDGRFVYTARRLMGSRIPFKEIEVEVSYPLEDKSLYLLDSSMTTPLQLLPLCVVTLSTEDHPNACYFYNKRVGDMYTMISYHYTQKSKWEGRLTRLHAWLKELGIII